MPTAVWWSNNGNFVFKYTLLPINVMLLKRHGIVVADLEGRERLGV
jgi:hypothetical protein